ncbi:hypothetical protein ACHAWF_016755 [Thalassiosira exigua]
MFDGSHRTNRREINLAGASASSKSSRTSHLRVARQQRLARAQAKAKLNAAKCLQRCWRGSRGRKSVAGELGARYRGVARELLAGAGGGGGGPPPPHEAGRRARTTVAASLLAYRWSPALLPFHGASRRRGARGGLEDAAAESSLRRDLLLLEDILRACPGRGPIVSHVASRRAIAVALVLLRQRIRSGNNGTEEQEENARLVRLLDHLLESSQPFAPGGTGAGVLMRDSGSLSTRRPSDYFMNVLRSGHDATTVPAASWIVNLFLCFRDFAFSRDGNGEAGSGGASPMDVDGVPNGRRREESAKVLLKWCCEAVEHLATTDCERRQRQLSSPATYQQALSLLASIAFGSSFGGGHSRWMYDRLLSCVLRLERRAGGGEVVEDDPRSAVPILIHFLSTSVSALSDSPRQKINGAGKVSGLMLHLSPIVCSGDVASAGPTRNPWTEALRETLSSREIVVLSQTLSEAQSCLRGKSQQSDILTDAVPPILHYALRRRPDLAILASISAQGEDLSLLTANSSGQGNVSVKYSMANAAAAAAFGREENVEEESDDDEAANVSSQEQRAMATTKSTTTSSGKHSRADLQTLPKLDALYQTSALRAKKATIERLRSSLPAHEEQVNLLVSLADTIGKGEWIQQLGIGLFSSSAPSAPSGYSRWRLLAPLDLASWRRRAQTSYTHALATVMTSCSGIKAGRNAASPFLARVAFHEPFLSGLWERSRGYLPTLANGSPPSKADDCAATLGYELVSSFCDAFSHHLLATADDDFLERYHRRTEPGRIVAKDIVLGLKRVLNDLYWIDPVLASDVAATRSDSESNLRFQRARLLLSGTKLWNALYERWCRLHKRAQFCSEDCWWFPHLASRGTHDGNPIVRSQATTRYRRLAASAEDGLGGDGFLCSPDGSPGTSPRPAGPRRHRLDLARPGQTRIGGGRFGSCTDRSPSTDPQLRLRLISCPGTPPGSPRGPPWSPGSIPCSPPLRSQATTFVDEGDDAMDDSSVEDEAEEAAPASSDDVGGDALASAFRDAKMARVLTFIPQAMPFSRRVTLFNALLESDKLRTQDESTSFVQMMLSGGEDDEIAGRVRVRIRRDALYADSKSGLNHLGKKLRKRVQVEFVNRHGRQEAGIDGGGVLKEFVDDLIKDAFLPKDERNDGDDDDSVSETHPDFFSVTPLQTLTVNALDEGQQIDDYEFLGRVLGKAIYESILVEPQFSLPFLNKLLGKQNSLDDLKNLDPEYYKNLQSLRHMSTADINGLGLTFELHDAATAAPIELMPGGSAVSVTRENVIQYIHLVSHQKMNVRGSCQTAAFLRGFRDLIPAQWVRLFSAYELQKLISGDDAVKGIDVRGMMAVMRYSGGLHPSQPIVRWLWEVVEEMTPELQRKFLKFMTSCSRQPLLGFGSMVPAPCIQQTRLREDDYGNDIAEGLGTGNVRLPSSSTCMNLLKLPKYTSKEMLKKKLLYAIESAAGFELS